MKLTLICFGDIEHPQNGYTIRSKMLAQRLSREGHGVKVLQFTGTPGHSRVENIDIYSLPTRHERSRVRADLMSRMIGFNPFSEIYFQVEAFYRLLKHRSLLRNSETVYLGGCLILSGFVIAKLFRRPIILDTHCINREVAIKLKQQSPLMGSVRSLVWKILEGGMMNHSEGLVFVSEHDQHIAESYYGLTRKQKWIIPNEVTKPDYEAYKEAAHNLRVGLKLEERSLVCFIGDLGAIQNAEAERYIREELAPATRDIFYILVGKNPYQRQNQENVIYTGFVDSLDPYIIAADVCIAPLALGSGTKTKVLDYLKYNKRIVATPVGAEGIDITEHPKVSITKLANFPLKLKEVLQA